MKTRVVRDGRTVIPAAIRNQYQIREGDWLVWIAEGRTIRVIPISADILSALEGSGAGEKSLDLLLEERKRDLANE
jgi:AbrB family looped-hinge helix DNA binding protein